MSHLEDLLCEYLMWKQFLVRRNERVKPLSHGGHAGELDIVAYSPKDNRLLHIEPSLDADTWKRREERYRKKFELGRDHAPGLFAWAEPKPKLEQIAIFVSASPERMAMHDGRILTVDEVVYEIRAAVCNMKKRVGNGAISEQYPLLRTIQLLECGYYRRMDKTRLKIVDERAQ